MKMDEERRIDEVGHLEPMEGKVFRHLALLNEERDLKARLASVRARIEKERKSDSRLMTLIGHIQRADLKLKDPDKFKKLEEAAKRKSEAKKAVQSSIPQEEDRKPAPAKREASQGSGSSRERLTKRMREGPSPVDKTLQTEAEK